ncbi:unnamed protein product [Nippostrongylus brasiliensis]|uniref:Signal recognition particle-docking protein FtsY n=1 Tax=Nippostrongylus brasiliensis TaxID=27835 RepID=A0A0N4XX97_NIPBR|nr:hypothetical protein Q1695_007153 [Nippostrongylus brasiliensis]VDL71180.1 unnamed protein product [Nippostrongylus brasiliensis]
MNAFGSAAIILLFVAIMLIEARSGAKRQAGSNTYGDELSVPPTEAPYAAGVEVTIAPAPEEEPAPVVENVAPVAAPVVVESGYRAKRQAGSNTYGDEVAVPEQVVVEPVEKAPEEVPEPVPVEPVPGPAPEVVQSGY